MQRRTIVAAIAIAALSSIVAGAIAGAAPDVADELWKQASEHEQADELDEARRLWTKLADDHPESEWAPFALLNLARPESEGDAERAAAKAAIVRLIETYPDHELVLDGSITQRVHGHDGWPALVTRNATTVPPWVPAGSPSLRVSRGGPPAEFRIYRVSNEAYLDAIGGIEGILRDARSPILAVPRAAWKEVSRRKMHSSGEGSYSIPLVDRKPGLFILEERGDGLRAYGSFTITATTTVVKTTGRDVLVWVADPETGAPVAGANVTLLSEQENEDDDEEDDADDEPTIVRHGPVATDAAGLARFERSEGELAVVVERGEEIHWVRTWGDVVGEQGKLVHVTTDRPIYRPAQTVHWKAVRRDETDAGGLRRPAAGETVGVEIRDPRGRTLASSEHPWNEAGSISGSFTLTPEPALGDYNVVVKVDRPANEWDGFGFWFDDEEDEHVYWSGSFTVAAYRKPQSKVSVELVATEPVLGAEVRARVRADYYHGGPVTDARVEYTVLELYEEDYGWWGGFGAARPPFRPAKPIVDPHAWFHEGRESPWDDWWYDDWGQEESEIKHGEGQLDADGVFEITFPTAAGEDARDYLVQVYVTDESRLEVEGEATITLLPAAVKLAVGTDRMFVGAGETVDATAIVTDGQGDPIAGREVEVVAFMARDPHAAQIELESFFRGTATSDAEGEIHVPVAVPESGRLRLLARAKDGGGRRVEARADLWVAGPATLPDVDDDEELALAVISDRLAYAVGEEAKLMVRTTRVPLRALLTVEGDGIREARMVEITERCSVISVPLPVRFAPNVAIRLTAFEGGEGASDGAPIVVVPTDRFLDVAVAADAPSYGPRQKAKITVETLRDGIPVDAEVELAIVDEKIFDLVDEDDAEATDPRIFFHRLRQDRSETASLTGAISYSGDGGGGGAGAGGVLMFDDEEEGGGSSGGMLTFGADDGAGEAEHVEMGNKPTETRRLFPDTLHWVAHARTGSDGRVEIDVETPDSLTRWRVIARVIAGDDGFGGATSEMLTRKDVVARVAAPRFLVAGDETTIATIIHNDADRDADFTVAAKVAGIAVVGDLERKIRVAKGGKERIDWKVTAPNAPGAASFAVEALSSVESDAMEIDLPVRRFGMETVLTARGEVGSGTSWVGELTLPEASEDAVIELSVARSEAAVIEQALPWLAGYPYGCVEQTMSRFLPTVVASGAMRRLGVPNATLEEELPHMVAAGLARLYHFQHGDGGWGWWTNDETDPEMTAYVMAGLVTAKEAGYPVDERVLASGYDALLDLETTPFVIYAISRAAPIVRALREARRARRGDDEDGLEFDEEVDVVVDELIADVDLSEIEDEVARTEATAYLVLAGAAGLADGLRAPGADDEPGEAGHHEVRAAALVLRALHRVRTPDGGEDPRIGATKRWLLGQRRGAIWHSTLDTAHAVYALAEVATDARPPLCTIEVNGRPIPLERAFAPGRFRIDADALHAGKNRVKVSVPAGGGTHHVGAALRYFGTDDDPEPVAGELAIARRLERLRKGMDPADDESWEALATPAAVLIGDELRFVITVENRADGELEYLMIEAPIPAGTEAIDDPEWDPWDSWYVRRELRDDRVCAAVRYLGGEERLTFRIRPTAPGVYRVPSARIFDMYAPDRTATSRALKVVVLDRD